MKTIAIGGEPATGKSTLVKAILASVEPSHGFSFGRVKGHTIKKENLWILGIYNPGETFPGTDRLSMSVHPDAVAFLKHLKAAPIPQGSPKPTILVEGDRLVGGKFLQECQKHGKLYLMMLSCPADLKHQRHQDRKDTQSPTFLQGKATKAMNLIDQFDGIVERHDHHTPADTERLKNLVLARVRRID